MNIQSDIAAARAKLDAVSAELRALEERAKKEATAHARWEPKGGDFRLTASGTFSRYLFNGDNAGRDMLLADGTLYPTREAAESALPYVTFFKRLCCLAQELNPSGKVGGRYYVTRPTPHDQTWKARSWVGDDRGCFCIFETEAAANRAAEIMNRDSWEVPSL